MTFFCSSNRMFNYECSLQPSTGIFISLYVLEVLGLQLCSDLTEVPSSLTLG